MLTYEKIKEYYDLGFWDNYRVGMAVRYGKITPEQYQEITGEAYVA